MTFRGKTTRRLHHGKRPKRNALHRRYVRLAQTVWEHKEGLADGFTKKYDLHTLVYFELHDDMTNAIQREKQLKKWNRAWKKELIEKQNPYWNDLWSFITGQDTGFPPARE